LDFKQIHEIYKFIKEEIQNVFIELEVPQADGTYPTSLLRHVEMTPETKAKNAKRILDKEEFSNASLSDINDYFLQLAAVTRITREIYYFIIHRGTFEGNTFSIYWDEAIRILNISEESYLMN